MKNGFLLIALLFALILCGIAEARCGGASRQGFFARRRAARQGSCGASASYSESHSYQMRGSTVLPRGGSCGPN